MRTTTKRRRKPGVLFGSMLVSFVLVAAACGDKDDGGDGGDSTEAPDETTGSTDGGTDTTGAPDSTAVVTTAPQETQPPAPEPEYGGTIVVGGEAEVANPWIPAAMQCDSFCQMRARSFFDPLVVVDQDLNWRPFLAESIEANEDSTVFTVKVREGISFHDGTPLNADAVIDNLKRTASGILVKAAVKDLALGADGLLLIEKLDDMTFTLQTGKDGDPANPITWPLFPYYLGGQFGLIASPTWLAAADADPTLAPQAVGTGPFVFGSFAPGDNMVVNRNENYWLSDANGNQLPYLDSIEFKVIPDSQTRATALQSGDLDMMSTSDAAVLSDLEGNEDFPTLLQNQYGETNYILMHLTKPYLADQSVRCALLQAVDKEDLIDVIANGNADPANGPFSPGQEGYLADNGSLPYDQAAASAAIEAYEAANGPLTINYSTTTATVNLLTAQYLQEAWGQVGVDVTIDQIEQSKLINNALFGDAAFDAFGWRNHAGLFADTQYYWWHSSAASDDGQLALNFGRLRDTVIDDLLDKSRQELDPDLRRGYAEDINRRFAEQCFIIPTSFTKWGVVSNTSVQGIGQTPQADGDGFLRDGAGFPGQVWLTAVFQGS